MKGKDEIQKEGIQDTIEKELIAVTKVTYKPEEDRLMFIRRLLREVNDKVVGDDWRNLSIPCKLWVNANAVRLNNGELPTDFDGTVFSVDVSVEKGGSGSVPSKGAKNVVTSSAKSAGNSKREEKKMSIDKTSFNVGDEVLIITDKDDEIEGVVAKVAARYVVLDGDDGEQKVSYKDIAEFEVTESASDKEEEEEENEGETIDVDELEDGMEVEVETSGGEYEGTVSEIKKLSFKVGADRIKKKDVMNIVLTEGAEEEEEDEGEEGELVSVPVDELEDGEEYTFVMQDGSTITGEVTEVSARKVTVDVDGKESKIFLRKVDTVYEGDVTPPGGGKKKEEKEKASAPAGKPARRGGGITNTIREFVCQDINASKDDVAKRLAKEGIDFNPSTLNLMYSEISKVVELLRANKYIKK